MRERLIAYIWPALRPLIVEVLKEALELLRAEQEVATRPARQHFGRRGE